MKATDLLRSHHRDVEQLLSKIEGAEIEERSAMVDTLAEILVAHAVVEKEILYPSFLDELGSDEVLLESLEEQGLIDTCLQKLLSVPVDDETFDAKLAVLRQLVEHHVDQQEDELLSEMDRSLGPRRIEELGAEMEQLFEHCRSEGYEALLAAAVADYVPRPPFRSGPARPARRFGARAVR